MRPTKYAHGTFLAGEYWVISPQLPNQPLGLLPTPTGVIPVAAWQRFLNATRTT